MFERPNLQQLIDRARADLLSRLAVDDELRRNDADAYAKVFAAATHALYSYIEYVALQILPDSADEQVLQRHADIWNRPRILAGQASGTMMFTTEVGAVIQAGKTVKAFDGVEYQVVDEVTATDTSTEVDLLAVLAGAAGNRTTGQTLTLIQPIPGVQPAGVASALVGGADIESIDSWRARILERIRKPPHGGAKHDYVAWALEVPGVTRAWCYPEALGLGTVVLRFVRDGDVSIIPDAGEVEDVQEYLDARRPVTAHLTVVAPVAAPINFTIDGLDPDSSEVRAAIEAELRDLLKREAEPGGTILLSHLRAAISVAAKEHDHVLTSPAANVTHTTNEMPTFGGITWI